jgi:hypothetical protein
MARVPPLPYRVTVTIKVGESVRFENHNSPDLPGAWTMRDNALRKPHTKKVEVTMILDESTPDHQTSAVVKANGASPFRRH